MTSVPLLRSACSSLSSCHLPPQAHFLPLSGSTCLCLPLSLVCSSVITSLHISFPLLATLNACFSLVTCSVTHAILGLLSWCLFWDVCGHFGNPGLARAGLEALGPRTPTRMEGKKNQRVTVPGLSPKLSPGAQHQALAPVLGFPSFLTPHSHLGGEFSPSLCPEGSHTCADQLVYTPASAVSTSRHPTESLRLPCRGRRRDCQKRKRLSSPPTASRPGTAAPPFPAGRLSPCLSPSCGK